MKNVIVIGGGLVGMPMAMDLSLDKDIRVTLADRDLQKLAMIKSQPGIATLELDVTDRHNLKRAVEPFDLVVLAVPGHLGFGALKTILESGKTVVDISFFPEDLFELDAIAKKHGVTAICDMGVAPGMSHLLSAHAMKRLDETNKVRIYVGGLPKVREWPWEYKAVFSPADVIEEYTRPARLVRDGKLIILPALSEPEILSFPSIGELEAFNSDGLRSLVKTLKVPDMAEKTLRYPGHIDKIKVMQSSGFFCKEAILINQQPISPFEFTSGLLFDAWKMKEGDEDITVMKIEVSGIKEGKSHSIVYDLYDEYDPASGIHSMARTTGYAATMTARALLKGMFADPGVFPPELLAKEPGLVEFILEGLRQRNVIYQETIKQE
ncbi:MAG: saccharopine dehydrogenase NADP-binding domain-containing protein [Bacteroidetes bacterium]|nr:saccharopine dehydrogenase NADP-binding domain-containing protein [Bacteroidota bacterium]